VDVPGLQSRKRLAGDDFVVHDFAPDLLDLIPVLGRPTRPTAFNPAMILGSPSQFGLYETWR
jgi:hypothetical protein